MCVGGVWCKVRLETDNVNDVRAGCRGRRRRQLFDFIRDGHLVAHAVWYGVGEQ